MGTLLISSVMVVPLLIARWTATRRSSRLGLMLTLALALVFNVLYALSMVYLYFRLA